MKLTSSTSILSTIAFAAFSGAAAADDGKNELLGIDMSTNSPGQHMYDWTGFYAGIHGGYLWGDIENANSSFGDFSIDGALFGAQAGAAVQNGMFVFGAEADIAISGAEGGFISCCAGQEGLVADLEWLATLRGTAGVAFDKVYVYATGGVAIAGVDFSVNNFGIMSNVSDTWTGWTAGAGGNLRLSERVSANAQYLYLDLGDSTVPTGWSSPFNYSMTGHVMRVGINIHN
jgi:outer membrane immunogenic protein